MNRKWQIFVGIFLVLAVSLVFGWASDVFVMKITAGNRELPCILEKCNLCFYA